MDTQQTSQMNNQKLAVLIDADNACSSTVRDLMKEISKYGVPVVKRIYGDWTNPNLKGWKNVLLEYAISPMQQFSYTVGKNSTDHAMIIDAMDLLYTGKFNAFCIVTSDGDFTRLASRIRESGLMVYGFGKKLAPNALVSACDEFVYVESLKVKKAEPAKPINSAAAAKKTQKVVISAKQNKLQGNLALVELLRSAVSAELDESGWAHLGDVGNYLSAKYPDFDPRKYDTSCKKLSDLIKATELFEIDERKNDKMPNLNTRDVYIRSKSAASEDNGGAAETSNVPENSGIVQSVANNEESGSDTELATNEAQTGEVANANELSTIEEANPWTAEELKNDSTLVDLLNAAVSTSCDERGWAFLGTIGKNIRKEHPDFDPHNYGYKKLSEIIKVIGLFEVDERKNEKRPSLRCIFIKNSAVK